MSDLATVRLLGPLDVVIGDLTRNVSGSRRMTVLATLAMQPGEAVSSDRLIDIVWNGAPPVAAANALQAHVSYLRRILGSRDSIAVSPAGYRLTTHEKATDVRIVEDLLERASRSLDPHQVAALLRQALSLWRGKPLAELSGHVSLGEQADQLERIHRNAVKNLTDVRLVLGEHAVLVPELEDLTQQHPFDEDIHGQLMLALYRTGRQADALAAFQRIRRRLDEDLGIVPGRPLRALEDAILHHDISIEPPPAGIAESRPVTHTVPAQLPTKDSRVIGRAKEIEHLDEFLARAHARKSTSSPTTVLTVSGTAGVGKTTLAVHWANRVADQFSDGQLYVDLRGFGPTGPAMESADALRVLLSSLGVPPHHIPAGLDERVGLYRSRLAGKRILVVLDNARGASQVRPLLPGATGGVALVTSRTHLIPLAITEGAHNVVLDPLPPSKAYALLTDRLGAHRVNAEQDAAKEIVELCGGLPLALTIAAAQAAVHPVYPLARLAADMRPGSAILDVLAYDDPTADLRTVFSWSYRALNTKAADLFRLLSCHSSTDITSWAAAELTGMSIHRVRPVLAELADAHLLVRHTRDKYTLHGLLRTYAHELYLRDAETFNVSDVITRHRRDSERQVG